MKFKSISNQIYKFCTSHKLNNFNLIMQNNKKWAA